MPAANNLLTSQTARDPRAKSACGFRAVPHIPRWANSAVDAQYSESDGRLRTTGRTCSIDFMSHPGTDSGWLIRSFASSPNRHRDVTCPVPAARGSSPEAFSATLAALLTSDLGLMEFPTSGCIQLVPHDFTARVTRSATGDDAQTSHFASSRECFTTPGMSDGRRGGAVDGKAWLDRVPGQRGDAHPDG